jgi:CMP-N,N'-diacetyllegionaminic acid synthase
VLVALIPARAGSQRIPHKNVKPLAGKPLLCWTLDAAKEAGIFDEIVVSTDDPEAGALASEAGVSVHLRESCHATSDAPDVGWVRAVLSTRKAATAYAILRPTAPFRTALTIRLAWKTFNDQQPCDSLRAVEPVRQHPGKMWLRRSNYLPGGSSANPAMGSAFCREHIVPLLPWAQPWQPSLNNVPFTVPWHSSPTQTLPTVYVQNASLEIAWAYTALPPSLTVAGTHDNDGSIAGESVAPFFTHGWEGYDINTPEDWDRAERHAQELLARRQALPPAVTVTSDRWPVSRRDWL